MTDQVSSAVDRIIAGGFDPRTSPWEHRVCVLLITAQGIIDNGGFEYFFESEFDGDPDMRDFPLVFEAVGAHESAVAVADALARAANGSAHFDDLNDVLWRESEHNLGLLASYVSSHLASYA